ATGAGFGAVMPLLAKTRLVIAVELQAHGHTADIDRPLTIPQLAEDVVALLRHLGVETADLFGFSIGAAVAQQIAITYPGVVRKVGLASVSYRNDGLHPGILDGIDEMKPEDLVGSPFHAEYLETAPRPGDWPVLVAKVKDLDRDFPQWPAEAIRSIEAPVLLVFGDSDLIRPEHAVEVFGLRGGGVAGDLAGLPRAQLAVVPGTTHIGLMRRADWLVPMVEAFLDRPA